MTESEAIETLIGIRLVSGYSKRREEALDMAIAALEKQVGKKLFVNMIEVFDYNDGYCDKPEYHCSACGRIIVKKHNYCPKCGQKIFWEDEE